MRRRTSGSARLRLLSALIAVLLLAAACIPSDDVQSDDAPAPDTWNDCTPFEKPTTVDQLNEQIQTARTSPQFRGGDVGASVQLSDERSLWVFGDTLRGPEAGDRLVHNSMLVFDATCLRAVVGEDGGAVIPDRDDGVGYWPMSVQLLSSTGGGDRVAVLAQRVHGTDQAWGFETLGPAVAIFTVAPGEQPELESVADLGPDNSDPNAPTWGAASWIDGGYVYLYGTSNPGDGSAFGYALRVARVPVEQLADQAAWTYWDGAQWQTDPASAQVLIGAVGGVSQTLSVIFKDNHWYAISKRDDFLGKDLVVWSSDAPTGPFVAHKPAASIPSDPDNKLYLYMPLAHPELFPQAGSLVVSYSRNTDDLAKLQKNPALYRPIFITITLPK